MVAETAVPMALWVAACWGAAGGGAVWLLGLGTDLAKVQFKNWPWPRATIGPRLAFLAIQLGLGSVVTAANHDQITGSWPAFILGISAPAVVQGIIARIEVEPDKPEVDAGRTEGGADEDKV